MAAESVILTSCLLWGDRCLNYWAIADINCNLSSGVTGKDVFKVGVLLCCNYDLYLHCYREGCDKKKNSEGSVIGEIAMLIGINEQDIVNE